jgi:DNA-3-methyladenine glycosylase
MKSLSRSFFARPTLEVARDLVGAVLCAEAGGALVRGRIVECEAYLGSEDPASHAARGPTPRSSIMFGPPGVAYVYFSYGMHHCLNFVTEPRGTAGAVLIRALEPLAGRQIMERRRGGDRPGRSLRRRDLCSGPGKLCQALGIDLAWNGLRLGRRVPGPRRLWLEPGPRPVDNPLATPRIGIRRAVRSPYRFLDGDSDCLSVRPGYRPRSG